MSRTGFWLGQSMWLGHAKLNLKIKLSLISPPPPPFLLLPPSALPLSLHSFLCLFSELRRGRNFLKTLVKHGGPQVQYTKLSTDLKLGTPAKLSTRNLRHKQKSASIQNLLHKTSHTVKSYYTKYTSRA